MSSDESIVDDTDEEFVHPRKRARGASMARGGSVRQRGKRSADHRKGNVDAGAGVGVGVGGVAAALSESWVDKYAPVVPSDLSIHPRKLTDLRKVLERMLLGEEDSPRLLVLQGPSGSCKSTSVKLLAEELLGGGSSATPYVEYHESASSSFVEFLSDAKYRGTGSNRSIILVEEYPNVFNESVHASFQRSLLEWLHTDEHQRLPPLVVCVTEVEHVDDDNNNQGRPSFYNIHSNLTVDTLLGKRVAHDERTEILKFNPVAITYIKKALGRLVQGGETRAAFSRIPKAEVNEFVANIGKSGDIRSSIANLQFWATLRSRWQGSGNERDAKSMEMFSIGKETQLGLFHAIGKIVYGSAKMEPSAQRKFEKVFNTGAAEAAEIIDVDEDSDAASTSGSSGVAAPRSAGEDYHTISDVLADYATSSLLSLSVLENYRNFNHAGFQIESAAALVDFLSVGDLLSGGGLAAIGTEIGARGVRSTLRSIGTHQAVTDKSRGGGGGSGGGPGLKFPSHFKLIREHNRVKAEIRDCQRYLRPGVSFQDLNLVHGCYEPKIFNSFKWKYAHGGGEGPGGRVAMNYNRLGGGFKQILPSDELPIQDEVEAESVRTAYDEYRAEIKRRIQADGEREGGGGGDEDDAGELSDPIEESDGSDDDFEDSIGDDEIDKLLSQSRSQRGQTVSGVPAAPAAADADDDFSSDDELDEIIRQRKF